MVYSLKRWGEESIYWVWGFYEISGEGVWLFFCWDSLVDVGMGMDRPMVALVPLISDIFCN
jgi:hypothetical protein